MTSAARGRSRGIYLISTLFILVLTVMMLGAALKFAPLNLHSASHFQNQAAAEAAARMGTEYALGRLRDNPSWRGDGNGVVVSVNGPEGANMVVEEDNGNVVGLLRSPSGEVSQFRLRFNYQDGTGGGDLLDDPASALFIDNPYVSLNNLTQNTRPLYRADGPNNDVTSTSASPHDVPATTVYLIVEGRAGAGFPEYDPLNPNLSPQGMVSTVVLESCFRVNGVESLDAQVMGGKSVEVELRTGGESVTLSTANDSTARIRSKGSVSVDGGGSPNLTAALTGEVNALNSDVTANSDTSITVGDEDPNAEFYKVTWDEVKKADPTGPSLAAGTYVIWEDGSLHYYDMNYEQYVEHIEANPSDAGLTSSDSSFPAFPSTLQFDGSGAKKRLVLQSDLHIASVTGTDAAGNPEEVTDFSVIPREGAPEEPPVDHSTLTGQDAVDALVVYTSQPSNVYDPGGLSDLFNQLVSGADLPDDSSGYDPVGPPGSGSGVFGFSTDYYGGYNGTEIGFRNAGTPSLELSLNGGDGPWFPADEAPSDLLNVLSQASVDVLGGNAPPYAESQMTVIGGSGQLDPEAMDEIDLGTITDSLTAQDIEIEITPAQGEFAILSASGDVRLGANLDGQGGAITSGSQIRIVGVGETDLLANANAREGVNLYAKDDIAFSTLREDGTQWQYLDLNLKGVVYTHSDFVAKLGTDNPDVTRWGILDLTGTLVAYGGDPESQDPGANGKGKVYVRAEKADLKFDPAYIGQLLQALPGGTDFEQILSYVL